MHYPTPQALVGGVFALDEMGDRYLVAPIDQPVEMWLSALESAGIGIRLDYDSPRFRVYRLSVVASDA